MARSNKSMPSTREELSSYDTHDIHGSHDSHDSHGIHGVSPYGGA